MPNELMRLNIEIDADSFLLHDSLSGETIIFENDQYKSFDLDRSIVIKRLQVLHATLLDWTIVKSWKQPSDVISDDEHVVIREDGQDSWTISHKGYSSKLANGRFKCHRKLNTSLVLSRINKMIYNILTANQILQPDVDIVRRIPDAGLVVWTHQGHSTVCYESGIKGATMTNCLIDGTYYDLVLVQSDESTQTCTLLTTDFRVIVEYPLDESIKFFYKDDEINIQ